MIVDRDGYMYILCNVVYYREREREREGRGGQHPYPSVFESTGIKKDRKIWADR